MPEEPLPHVPPPDGRRPHQRRNAVVALCALVLVSLGAVSALRVLRSPGADAATNSTVQELYALRLEDGDGRVQALEQWRGHPLLINFWATWCGPCVEEMPALDRLRQEFAGQAVAIVGIGTEDRIKVKAFRDRLNLHLPLLAGGYDALALARSLGDRQGVLPYTVLLGSDGRILQQQAGALDMQQVRSWLSATTP